MPSDEFAHESLQDGKSIAAYLRALVQCLESGYLELGDERGELVLHPSGLLGLELKAQRKGSRVQLLLALSWTEDRASEPRAASLRLRSRPSE